MEGKSLRDRLRRRLPLEPLRIFISYRRADTRGYAGWLYNSLRQVYGAQNIFRDVAALQAGRDFMAEIDKAIGRSDVVLCLIGSQWLGMKGPNGSRRLDDPQDPVRIEVATALRKNKALIPVLVDRATFPKADELPADLHALCDLTGLWLDDDGWDQDLARLVEHVNAHRPSEKLTGVEIARRFTSGDEPPKWIGRGGGRQGKLFQEDVETGRWRTWAYEVSYRLALPNPRAWMSTRQFIEAVSPKDE